MYPDNFYPLLFISLNFIFRINFKLIKLVWFYFFVVANFSVVLSAAALILAVTFLHNVPNYTIGFKKSISQMDVVVSILFDCKVFGGIILKYLLF